MRPLGLSLEQKKLSGVIFILLCNIYIFLKVNWLLCCYEVTASFKVTKTHPIKAGLTVVIIQHDCRALHYSQNAAFFQLREKSEKDGDCDGSRGFSDS